MQSRDLALFVQAARSGSLSQAGRDLGLSPATASARLSALEQDLGVRLMHRTTRSLTLTAEGQAFLAYATRILDDLEEARAAVSGTEAPRGRLRVAVPAFFGRITITTALPEFLRRYPGLVLDMDYSDAFVNLVEQGFDVAIRIGNLPDSALIARRLAPNARVICAAPSYLATHGAPQRPEDLADHDCVTMANMRRWSFARPGGPLTVEVSGRLLVNSGDALRDAGLAGLGLVLKSTWDVGEDLRRGDLVPVLADHPLVDQGAIWAVYPSARLLAPKVRAFVDFFADHFATKAADLPPA
ncbi:LysR family transcriptional regulator [Marinibaculum pumilum]|uniref:LysR family transcriptional regulator n=1 Tax=Marinibaculum pumilum TaxID=1766165 RepID=A0ABV7KVA2_9PROT